MPYATRLVSRAQFLRIAAGGAFGTFVVLQSACGGDDDGDGPPPVDAPPAGDGPAGDGALPIDASIDASETCIAGTTTIINGNHGHMLTVTVADVKAAQPRTYDISGTAGHLHTVTVTAAQFTLMQQGQTVNITSSTGSAHSHAITVRCA